MRTSISDRVVTRHTFKMDSQEKFKKELSKITSNTPSGRSRSTAQESLISSLRTEFSSAKMTNLMDPRIKRMVENMEKKSYNFEKCFKQRMNQLKKTEEELKRLSEEVKSLKTLSTKSKWKAKLKTLKPILVSDEDKEEGEDQRPKLPINENTKDLMEKVKFINKCAIKQLMLKPKPKIETYTNDRMINSLFMR